MELEHFLEYLNREEIPPTPPDCSDPGGWHSRGVHGKSKANQLGMWAIVCQTWVKELAWWIQGQTVLEVMAGRGWLAKALHEAHVDIIATDDFSWKNGGHPPVYPVEKLEATRAIEQNPGREVLLICWPPYDTNDAARTITAWGTGRPVIYIGESQGGCNANDRFFETFQPYRPQPDGLWLPSWPGMHDYITIGEYRP